jgi:hypothetical protein
LLNTQFNQFHRIDPFHNGHIAHYFRKKNKLATPHHSLYGATNYSLPFEIKIPYFKYLSYCSSSNLMTSSKVVRDGNGINSYSNQTIPGIAQIPVCGTYTIFRNPIIQYPYLQPGAVVILLPPVNRHLHRLVIFLSC